jgi:hypothetical protein
MRQPSSRAPLAHATILLVCLAGKYRPTVQAQPQDRGEVRLGLDVAGAGYGANVALVGPPAVLAEIVADLAAALEGVSS